MEKKEWKFGWMQPTVTIENNVLKWKNGTQSGSYPLKAVHGFHYETEFLTASIKVIATGSTDKVAVGKSDQSRKIVDEINEYINSANAPAPTPVAPVVSSSLIADELIKLASLRDAGILTEEEFQGQKVKLLNR